MAQPEPTSADIDRIREAPLCTICKLAPDTRDDLELTLAYRSRRLPLPDGNQPTYDWITRNCERLWGIKKLNRTTITRHLSAHIRIAAPDKPSALPAKRRPNRAQAVADLLEANPGLLAELNEMSGSAVAEEFLKRATVAGLLAIQASPETVSPELAARAATELLRRKTEESTNLLMAELVHATGAALRRVGPPQPRPEPQTDQTVEAVIVREIEVGSRTTVRDPTVRPDTL